MLAVNTQNDWFLRSIDTKIAFLHGERLNKDVQLQLQPESNYLKVKVLKLHKYGHITQDRIFLERIIVLYHDLFYCFYDTIEMN